MTPAPIPQLGNFVNTIQNNNQTNQPPNSESRSNHQHLPMTVQENLPTENPKSTLQVSPRPKLTYEAETPNQGNSTSNLILVGEQASQMETENQEVTIERDENTVNHDGIHEDGEQSNKGFVEETQIKSSECVIRRQNSNPHQFFKMNVERIVPTSLPIPIVVGVGKKALNVNLLSLCQICVFLPLNIFPIFLHHFYKDCLIEDINVLIVGGFLLLITFVGLIGFPILSEKKLDNF